MASVYNSSAKAIAEDEAFATDVDRAFNIAVFEHQQEQYKEIMSHVHHLGECLPLLVDPQGTCHSSIRQQENEVMLEQVVALPIHTIIANNTPINTLRQRTIRLFWHQRLGHCSDEDIYTAHKFADGVPLFKHRDPVLAICPTCIRAKLTKCPATGTTRKATRPFQGLSVDFSFLGMKSKNEERVRDYEGIHGETSWLLIKDLFSRFVAGSTHCSKAVPIQELRNFLHTYCPGKGVGRYVYVDQGSELYQSPKVRKLFKHHGFEVRPTGADSSHQNGPVERQHRTVAGGMRAMFLGASLNVTFWPNAFKHYVRIRNSLPSREIKINHQRKLILDKKTTSKNGVL